MNIRSSFSKKSIDFLVPLFFFIAIIAGEALYFWETLARNELMGLGADSLLVTMFLQHWYDIFSSDSPILTLRSFWPEINTLGYSETMLGPGIIYSIIHSIGIDIFTAHNITFVLLHFCGVIFIYLSLRELGINRFLSFVGILLSFWSCSFSQLSYHTQFFSLSYVPVFLFFSIRFLKKRGQGLQKRLFYGVLSTFSFGLLWLSSFYTAYFTTLFLLICLFILFIYSIKSKGLSFILKFVKKHYKEALFYAFLQLIWAIPLLIIYLPFYLEHGGYNEAFTIVHSPLPFDILRTASYAPIETFLRKLFPTSYIPGYEALAANIFMETSYGWPFIAFILFLTCIPLSLIVVHKKNKFISFLLLDAIITTIILYLAICRFGNTSAWVLLRNIIPGATAIRAPGRLMGILTVPMAIVVCYSLSIITPIFYNKTPSISVIIGFCLVFSLVIASNADHHTNIDTANIKARLNSVSPPPAECKVVIAFPPSLSDTDGFIMNMEGWLIADKYKLNTINGYSGNSPDGWKLIQSDASSYFKYVHDWLEYNNKLNDPGIYFCIVENNLWVKYSDLVIRYE